MTARIEKALEGRRIFAIDDDPVILSTIKMMLQSSGAICETAENGRDGLAELRTFGPHMLLLDYMMPNMYGPEVYRTIQTDERYAAFRRIPILMLTAKTDNTDEQQTLFRMGLDAYLYKPFGFRELVNVIANVFALHDVRSENARLHDEIRQVRNYLQSILDHITDIVSVQDRRYKIQKHNASAEKLHADERLDGRFCHEVFFAQPTLCPGCPVADMLATGRPSTSELRSKDGSRLFEVSTYPIRSADGDITTFVEIIKDTTERRRLEQRLIESSKLASLGTLAAGVAHEINNPLCIILGFAQSLAEDKTLPDAVQRELTIIEQEAARCGKTLQDLLSFAKPSSSQKASSCLSDILKQCSELLNQMFKRSKIEVTAEYAEGLPPIYVDVSKIQQVFVNILLNSIQAMPDGGTLGLSMRFVAKDQAIETVIRDTGPGIPAENMEKVFDPFFTTKFGTGTGLGLAISRAIVHEHLGTLKVTSLEGRGTSVEVSLPVGREIL